MDEFTPWWKIKARFKPEKAVVRLYDDDQFLTSVNIPSVYWPLNGPYEAFHWENTCYIHGEPKLEAIVNSAEYQVGRCYHNSEALAAVLHGAGYENATVYCGWAFLGETTPIHHCWIVVTDEHGQKAILDLSCDFYQMAVWLSEQEDAGVTYPSSQEGIIAWSAYSRAKLSNVERCYPLGKLPPYHLYIGCPCSPRSGIQLYSNLLRKYPQHLADRKVNSEGYNALQWELKQRSLIP